MIEAFCITSVDGEGRESWPRVFGTLPRMGDTVTSRANHTLYVIAITHTSVCTVDGEKPRITVRLGELGDVPILRVRVIVE